MIQNLLEQLAECDVPPVPAGFDREVHRRVNDSLLAVHLVELVFQVMPYAVAQFAQALAGLVGWTLSGRFPHDRGERRRTPP